MQLVIAAGGAAIGAEMGWGILGMSGAQVGWMAGSMLGSQLFAPDQPDVQGPRLSDTKVQVSTYGIMIPIVYASNNGFRLTGNVIWSTDLIETATTTEFGGGGKGGGGGGGSSTTYTYSVNCAVGICEGPCVAVKRIWANGELIYDGDALPAGITLYQGSEDQAISSLMESYLGVGNVPAHRGMAYMTCEGFQLQKYGNRIPNFSFEIYKSCNESDNNRLSNILLDLCERSGLSNAQIDTIPLWYYKPSGDPIVPGFGISSQMSARNAIGVLQSAYFFDGVESDGMIKFVSRGNPPIATIPESDLAAHEWGQDMPEILPLTRQQELELPRVVSVIFMDVDQDYQQGTQQSVRFVGGSINEVTLQLAIAMDGTKAKEIAEVNQYNAWQQRTTIPGIQLSRKWSALEPTDVVSIIKGGTIYSVRLIKKDEGNPGIIKFDGVLEDIAVYTQTGAPANPSGFIPQTVAQIADTSLVLLDIPILRDTDDDTGFYAAACGNDATKNWPGYAMMKSLDAGTTYSAIGSKDIPASIGTASTTLGSFSGGNTFDEINSVTVVMTNGILSSATESAILNGVNAAVIGSEVIQFKNAALVATNTYKLTGLLRGQRGTEWAIGTHGSSETFVFVSASSWLRIAAPAAEIGLSRKYKGVTFTKTLASATAQDFTNNAIGLKPFAPCQLGGGRDASLDITINWLRRTRIGGEWRDNVDASLGEASELYDVEIWNSGYTTLKRTFSDLVTTTISYTAAQQTTDFGSTQATIYLRVYQKSATIGRGYKLEGTI